MTEDLKNMILKAAGVLQQFGANDVFFFGSVAKVENSEEPDIDLAVSGLPPEVYFHAMGGVLSVIRRKCNLVDLDEKSPYVEYLKSHGKIQPEIGAKIKNEFSQLHEMLDHYRSLIEKSQIDEPTSVEVIALAGILQLMYSGFNKIFKLIVAEYDGGFKKVISNDTDLLERMVMPTPKRSAVLSKFLMEQLHPYLSFRHFFCNTYTYNFNWEKMKNLVAEAEEILLLVEAEFNVFMNENC